MIPSSKLSRVLPYIFALVLALLLGNAVHGESASTCSPYEAMPSALAGNACEIEFQANGCAQYMQDHPQAASHMRQCSREPSTPLSDWASGCKSGLVDAGGDIRGWVGQTWSNLLYGTAESQAEQKAQAEFERICSEDQSLAIKRQLNADAWLEGVSRPVTDEQLKSTSCTHLIEAVRARQNFAVTQDYIAKLDTPEFREQWGQQRDKVFNSMFANIEALATGLNIRLKCYSRESRAAVECQLVAAVAAGLAAKNISQVRKLAGLTDGESATTVAGRANRARTALRTDGRVLADFRESPKVQVWRETQIPDGKRVGELLPGNAVEPGASYTAMILDDKLILGKDIQGIDGRLGGAGSHVFLEEMAAKDTVDSAIGRSGAIRFNQDGSVDISGYHDKHPSPEAAQALTDMVRTISPETRIRMTGDRLSTLEAPP